MDFVAPFTRLCDSAKHTAIPYLCIWRLRITFNFQRGSKRHIISPSSFSHTCTPTVRRLAQRSASDRSSCLDKVCEAGWDAKCFVWRATKVRLEGVVLDFVNLLYRWLRFVCKILQVWHSAHLLETVSYLYHSESCRSRCFFPLRRRFFRHSPMHGRLKPLKHFLQGGAERTTGRQVDVGNVEAYREEQEPGR